MYAEDIERDAEELQDAIARGLSRDAMAKMLVKLPYGSAHSLLGTPRTIRHEPLALGVVTVELGSSGTPTWQARRFDIQKRKQTRGPRIDWKHCRRERK